MIPAFSPLADVMPSINMQHSPVLPPFTPHSKIRSTAYNRDNSPWKRNHPATERFPPLSKREWKDTPRDDAYLESLTLLSPTTHADQNKSFQSTTVLRSVPIMRRNLDTFGGRTFSLPAKTKPVPFHTGRFIYDPTNRPIFFEELTQNQRLQAEIAMVEKVRGLKRKREAMGYRWGWKKLDLYGFEMARGERYSLQAEVKKLKELVLPPPARDIYTGRGFRLPENHHINRAVKRGTEEPPYPPPPSTTLLDTGRDHLIIKPTSPHQAPPSHPFYRQHQAATKTARSREKVVFKQIGPQPHSQQGVDLLVQSIPVPGIAISPIPRPPVERSSAFKPTLDDAREPAPEPPPIMKMHEPVEQIEVIEPQPSLMEEEDTEKLVKEPSPFVAETPVDRSRSIVAPSASPDGKTQFNPLISVSAIDDLITTEDEYAEMKQKFVELDQKTPGHITFEQLMSVCPNGLTTSQCKFMECLYGITRQTSQFGSEEFIAMTSLAHKLLSLNPSTQAMFDQINFATLEESLMQYTELFSSVDRTGRGRIGVGAVLQILSTTLHRQLEPDTKLAIQIMETMQKEYSSDVPRLEFLAFLPYFLYLEEMS